VKLLGKIILTTLTWPGFLGWLFPIIFYWACTDLRFGEEGVLMATWRDWVLKPRPWLNRIKWAAGRLYYSNPDLGPGWHETADLELATARNLWRYSTTIARGMIFQPNLSPRTIQHEYVHVRQAEDRVLLAFVVSLVVAFVELEPLWLILWITGIAWQLPNFLTAVMRGGHVYRGADGRIGPEHERSAYAQTDTHHVKGVSWLDYNESREQLW